MAVNTRAPSTIVTIDLTGQSDFNIPFEYLARKFVEVTLLGIDRLPLTLNTDYRFVSKTMISLTRPYSGDYNKIEIRRVTSAAERLVDFHDGSILRAYDLNLSQIQTLHVAEEARDLTADTIGVNDNGHLDARGRKIVNLAYAENGGDAIPLGQVMQWNDSALNSANRAAQRADEAHVSAVNALSYAERSEAASRNADDKSAIATERAAHAETMANASFEHKQVAEAARDVAVQSKDVAVVEAAKAKTEADRAKTEADKLHNWNELAGAVTVTPNQVVFNRTIKSDTAGDGFEVDTTTAYVGYRLSSPLVQWAMVNNTGDAMEEHIKSPTGTDHIVRSLHTDGVTRYYKINEFAYTTRQMGTYEDSFAGAVAKRSITYYPERDERLEYDLVGHHKVLDASGNLIGGRQGSVTSVGSGIDIGLDPNVDYNVRIGLPPDPWAKQPTLIAKPNMNSASPVAMMLIATMVRENIGTQGRNENCWVTHCDDGYIEMGGIVTVHNTSPEAVYFPYYAHEVWDVSITPIVATGRGAVAEANSAVLGITNTGFQLHSGQTENPCRFYWRMKGRRSDNR